MAYQFTVSGDSREAQKAFEQLDRKVAQLQESNRKLAAQSRRANSEATRGADRGRTSTDRLASAVARVGAAYTTALGAVRLFTEGLADQNRRAQELNRSFQTLAAAQENAIRNLIGLPADERRRALTEVAPEISRDVGLPQREVVNALGAAVSAGATLEQAADAIRSAGELTRQNAQGLAEATVSAVSLGRATGVESARENLAFVQSAGSVAFVQDPRNLPGPLAAAVAAARVSAPEQAARQAATEAAAVFATLGQEARDAFGDATRTSSQALFAQLSEFFADRRDPGTLAGRITALQESERLRRTFLDEASFERQFAPFIRELVTPGSATAQRFQESVGAISFRGETFDRLARELTDLTPQLRVATRAARQSAQIESAELTQEGLASIGQVRETVARALRSGRQEGLQGVLDAVTENLILGSGATTILPRETELSFLEGALRQRRGQLLGFETGETRTDEAERQARRELTDSQREQVDLLKRIADQIEQLNQREGRAAARGRDTAQQTQQLLLQGQ